MCCRRLKEAKEKLRRLQELVAMVQQSPDMATSLPDDLAELAASVDDADSQFSQLRAQGAPASTPGAAVAAVSRANNVAVAAAAAAVSSDQGISYDDRLALNDASLQYALRVSFVLLYGGSHSQ